MHIKLLRHFGFSMTELMVAMGLLGGVSLVGMQLFQETASNDSYLRFKSEVAKATAIIQTHLSDQNSCKTMIVGKVRQAYGAGLGFTPLTMVERRGGTIILLKEGEYDGFTIPSGGIKLETSKMESGTNTVTDLVLTFQIRGRSFKERKAGDMDTIVKRIPVRTEMNGSTIRSCGPVVADTNADAKKQLCDSLGIKVAKWITSTGECQLINFKCDYGQVPSQLTSLGQFECVPVQEGLDPNTFFDFSSDTCSGPGTAVQLIDNGSGKIKAQCL
jgi:prepilin-type N-terminal cleavage/methylation domain-containing protein